MSARAWLYDRLTGALIQPERVSTELDAYRAEILTEVAVTVRAAAPKYLDNEVDEHTFQVLNDLAAKIARGDLS